MAFNLTGFDEEVYFTVSSIVTVSLFLILVRPPLILCMLCVLALIFVTDVNRKIAVLLINLLAVEICNWLSNGVYYLGFPARIAHLPGDYSCQFIISSFTVVGLQKFTAGALYAVMGSTSSLSMEIKR